MIELHHLNMSRSQRIVWLLEELQVPYKLVMHTRDANMRGPERLKQLHPLGKSPTIVDGDLMLPESGAIVEYLVEKYGADKLAPKRGTKEYARYLFWLHFAEGSMMLPIMTNYYGGMVGEKGQQLTDIGNANHEKHLDYIDKELGNGTYLLGRQFTGADVLISYPLKMSERRGLIAAHPKIVDYLKRLRERPAYESALAKGGA
jgi:glutathione S-transferase